MILLSHYVVFPSDQGTWRPRQALSRDHDHSVQEVISGSEKPGKQKQVRALSQPDYFTHGQSGTCFLHEHMGQRPQRTEKVLGNHDSKK